MAKKSKAERKAEEARIIAEMDDAMQSVRNGTGNGAGGEGAPEKTSSVGKTLSQDGEMKKNTADGQNGEKASADDKPYGESDGQTKKNADGAGRAETNGEPQAMHCRRCGAAMDMKKGVCPQCGYRVYVPMDQKKAMKIRLILGAVLIVGLLVYLLVRKG